MKSTDQLINWFGCPNLIYKRKRIHLVAMLTTADFISCVTFGKSAEFAQKYLHKGMRIVIGGRISTGNYKDKDGKTIYTTDVIVEEHEFAQNKDNGAGVDLSGTPKADKDGFMEAPEGEIPFD